MKPRPQSPTICPGTKRALPSLLPSFITSILCSCKRVLFQKNHPSKDHLLFWGLPGPLSILIQQLDSGRPGRCFPRTYSKQRREQCWHGWVPHEYSRSKVYLGHLCLVSCAIASEWRAMSNLHSQTCPTCNIPPSVTVYTELLSKRGMETITLSGHFFRPLVTKELLNVKAFECLL